MTTEMLFKLIIIPFFLEIAPMTVVAINLFRNRVSLGDNQLKYALFFLVSFGLLAFSYFNVWSLLYGPMSKEDWGPGFVKVIGIVGFQLLPLIITVPWAIWVVKSEKT